jgi:sulfur carrier protein
LRPKQAWGPYNRRMDLFLNGTPHVVADALSLAQLLEQTGHAGRRVAVEVNREIVPRSAQATYQLRPGDRVEIVQAIGGG